VKIVKNVLTEAILEEENPRVIATKLSKQKVYRAMLLRKGAISVAREAFARKDEISV
jgi:glutamate dehydrogenase (NAD(P)+)